MQILLNGLGSSGLEEDKTDFDAGLTLIANTLLNDYCEPGLSALHVKQQLLR